MKHPAPSPPETRTSLAELAALFLRLGATAFGGPAAHIAMMQDEAVRRRGWLSEAQFLDLLGATNLIPGLNSTEMAIHIGWARRRFAGLLVAGVAFIVPAMLMTGVLGFVYVRFGSVPSARWLLYGVKPVILGVVLQAIFALAPKAARTTPLRVLLLLAVVLSALCRAELGRPSRSIGGALSSVCYKMVTAAPTPSGSRPHGWASLLRAREFPVTARCAKPAVGPCSSRSA